MTLQIRSISIYSRDGRRRDVTFRLGALNIVTGVSKTGKSALLDIVDYCWGRGECTVPEGEIRRAVSWFAVHFDNDGEGVLIARKNPGRASDEVFFARGVEALPDDPSGFQKNITAEGLKSQLAAVLNISENLHTPKEGSTRQPLEASSRHAILFCLQAQDEIANRRLLFHRQGEPFFPQGIRDVLPYFLGAVDEDHYIALMRYEDVRSRLRKVEREYAEAEAITRDASNAARSLVHEARLVGLIDQTGAESASQEVHSLLRRAIIPREIFFSTLDDPEADLAGLDERRRSLLRELQSLREEIADVERLNREASEFEIEAREQEARLFSIGLIGGDEHVSGHTCPLCQSQLAISIPTVTDIRQSLANVQTQLRSVHRDAPRLQKHLTELEARRASLSDQLRAVHADMAKRIQDNERLRIEQQQFTERARVAGRITFYLENRAAVSQDGDLPGKLAQLRAELQELEGVLDEEGTEERLATALNILGRGFTEYASRLRLEHGNYPLRLDLKRLTMVADTDDGPLLLGQMGSGENWVGYHVAAHLGLHRLFRRRNRPVPGFLMLDQPSQAHYPPERDDNGRIESLTDADQQAVKNLFELLYSYCGELESRMQIIVADHVELREDWFKGSIKHRWRDGNALVPKSWL